MGRRSGACDGVSDVSSDASVSDVDTNECNSNDAIREASSGTSEIARRERFRRFRKMMEGSEELAETGTEDTTSELLADTTSEVKFPDVCALSNINNSPAPPRGPPRFQEGEHFMERYVVDARSVNGGGGGGGNHHHHHHPGDLSAELDPGAQLDPAAQLDPSGQMQLPTFQDGGQQGMQGGMQGGMQPGIQQPGVVPIVPPAGNMILPGVPAGVTVAGMPARAGMPHQMGQERIPGQGMMLQQSMQQNVQTNVQQNNMNGPGGQNNMNAGMYYNNPGVQMQGGQMQMHGGPGMGPGMNHLMPIDENYAANDPSAMMMNQGMNHGQQNPHMNPNMNMNKNMPMDMNNIGINEGAHSMMGMPGQPMGQPGMV
jgi:hypothetical protein